MPDRSIAWWHSDSGVLPSAAPTPWTLTGSGVSLPTGASPGLLMVDSRGADTLTSGRQPFDPDSARSPTRASDWVWFQIRIKGVSATPGWAGGGSGIGLLIDDGARQLALSVGSSLQVVHPTTGAVVAVLSTSHPWLTDHTYMLEKRGSSAWAVYCDGKLSGTVGYLAAPPSTGSPAQAKFGSLDPSGTSTAYYDQPELGLNMAVPPQWIVERSFLGFPISMQNRWTEIARAGLRAGLGLIETAKHLLGSAFSDRSASRIVQATYSFTGIRLPSAEPIPWTLNNSADVSVERERIRIDAAGAARTGATITATTSGLPDETEWGVVGTWTVREYTRDANGRVGPFMRVVNGHATITAQLVEVTTGESWAWVLTSTVLTGGVVNLSDLPPYLVDIYQPMEVEVQVLGKDWVLLLVNRHIVERIPYATMPGGATSTFVVASEGTGAGAQGIFTVENVTATRRLCDLARRPWLLQSAVERLIFVGGCERNDELETWMQHHFEVEGDRGTTRMMTLEVRRISCSEDAVVVEEHDWSGWILGETFPGITPIWLGSRGFLYDVFLEFPVGAINFSPTTFARLARRYLVPTTTVELTYLICLAARMTGASAVVGPLTRVTVTSSEGFEVGDSVTLRDEANTVQETTTVTAIFSATAIDVPETAGTWVAGDRIRKTLATT